VWCASLSHAAGDTFPEISSFVMVDGFASFRFDSFVFLRAVFFILTFV
jgi:hypothetical protein